MFNKTKAKINKIAENVKLGTTNLKGEVKEIPCKIDKITNSKEEKIQLISRIAVVLVSALVIGCVVSWILSKLPQVAGVLIYLVLLITYFKLWGKKK
jgi:F0F1-type ATP synthase assembly protein I